MADLMQAAQQALEALVWEAGSEPALYAAQTLSAVNALRAALEQPEQPCNCRWVGDVQTQQCTLHEAHVDAIHEWAERAKAAEAKLAALEQPEQEPFGYIWPTGRHPEFRYTQQMRDGVAGMPLYAHPPRREWRGLSEEDRSVLFSTHFYFPYELVNAVEAKLKELNHG